MSLTLRESWSFDSDYGSILCEEFLDERILDLVSIRFFPRQEDALRFRFGFVLVVRHLTNTLCFLLFAAPLQGEGKRAIYQQFCILVLANIL